MKVRILTKTSHTYPAYTTTMAIPLLSKFAKIQPLTDGSVGHSYLSKGDKYLIFSGRVD